MVRQHFQKLNALTKNKNFMKTIISTIRKKG